MCSTPAGTDCHHIIVEDWDSMEQPLGTLFVSIPSLLDPSLAPDGTHIFHAFAPEWIDSYQVSAMHASPCLALDSAQTFHASAPEWINSYQVPRACRAARLAS